MTADVLGIEGLAFEVLGNPAPQGSKRHVGNGILIESSKKVAPWRQAVAAAARDLANDHGCLDQPLTLAVVFRFPMPRSRPAAVRRAGEAPKTTTPDVDKLLRSTADGLVMGGLIVDDARLVTVLGTKREVVGWTGAELTLCPWPAPWEPTPKETT